MSFLSGLGKIAGAAGGFILSGGNPAGAAAGYGLAGSLLDGSSAPAGQGAMNSAAQTYGGYASQDRNQYMTALQGGQQAVNSTTQAAVANALPSYMQNLQSSRESAVARGASNGDLQTSFEGDLASAFQRNVSNAAAGQAANVYGQQVQGLGNLTSQDSNQYLNLIAGNRDAGQAQQNNQNSIYGSLLGAGASYLGAQKASGTPSPTSWL